MTGAERTTGGKGRAGEIEGGEGDVGAAEWASRNLGVRRGAGKFVAVVVGKGGARNLVVILSLLQCVSCSLLQKCDINFLDLSRG